MDASASASASANSALNSTPNPNPNPNPTPTPNPNPDPSGPAKSKRSRPPRPRKPKSSQQNQGQLGQASSSCTATATGSASNSSSALSASVRDQVIDQVQVKDKDKKKRQRQRQRPNNSISNIMPAAAASPSANDSLPRESQSQSQSQSRDRGRLNPNARPFVPSSTPSADPAPSSSRSRAIPIRRPASVNQQQQQPPPKQKQAPAETATKSRPLPAAATALAALSSHGHSYTPLALSLATDLIRGTKECVICCDTIKPRNPIWSCATCFAPLHLSCVKEWAASHTPPTTTSADQGPEGKSIRCPACNCTQSLDSSRFYTCFCGQVRNPPLDRFTTPHACGKTCDRTLPDCAHKCSLPCHPGPCSPCAKIITVACPGGHVKRQATCGSEAAKARVPCVAKCNRVLNCSKHTCERACHDDADQEAHKCTVEVLVACQCGRSDPHPFHCGSEPAVRKCDQVCNLAYPCGHKCAATCCPLSPADHLLCPLSPALISRCPCGKSPLNRKSCHDPTSTSCGKPCQEPLPCGHPCSRTCHADKDNHRCTSTLQATCRCGLVTSSLPCAVFNATVAQGDPFLCDQVCDAPLMCRRKGHKCKSVCCPASKAAIAVSLSSPSTPRAGSSSAWTSLESHLAHEALTADRRRQLDAQCHTCPHTCGKRLACGQHTCAYPCHAGACPPCLEAGFDELFCACGRSSILPPVPCGVTSVRCSFPCTRALPCGHPNLGTHECHPDSVACPPCVVLTEKPCACGKSTVGATRCSSSVPPACGARCGKPLACGHKCSLGCHDPATVPCVCRQVCGLRREMTCGHACPLPCHFAEGTCEEVGGACAVKVTRQCACGRLSQVGTCQPGRNSVPLDCDDGCRVAARNRVVADALKVGGRATRRAVEAAASDCDDSDHDSDDSTHPVYDQDTLEYARLHPDFAKELEHTFADLIAEAERDARGGVAMRNLKKPMRQPVRKFVHALAAAWHVHSESVDPEPKRLVILTAKRGLSGPPRWTCAEAVRKWVASGAMAVGTGLQVAPATARPKRAASAPVAAAAVNALVIQDTSLASALDVEPYCRLYFGSTPFAVVRHGPSRTNASKFEAVVQVVGTPASSSASAAYMPPHAVQDLIREVKGPLHSLLVDLGKARAVVEAYVDRKGKVSTGGGFTRVVGKKAAAATSTSEEDEGEDGDGLRGIVPVGTPMIASRNAFESLLDLPSSPAKPSGSSAQEQREETKVVDDWEQEADD